MKISHSTTCLTAFCLTIVLPAPVLAQLGTPVGTVKATIDGAAYEGETLDVPSEGTSTAEVQSMGPMMLLSIQAHDPEADSIMHNILTMDIGVMGEGNSASVISSSISWWPGGMSEPFYDSSSSEVAMEVTLDSFAVGSDESSVKGSFSARMCRIDSFSSEADMSDCIPVEGTFDTVLLKVD